MTDEEIREIYERALKLEAEGYDVSAGAAPTVTLEQLSKPYKTLKEWEALIEQERKSSQS